MTATAAVKRVQADPTALSAIAGRGEPNVNAAIAVGDRSNRRVLRDVTA